MKGQDMDLQEEYFKRCSTPSDINEHLPTLRHFSSICDTVTEMGVRDGNSTVALACGNPNWMISYDLNPISPALLAAIQREIVFNFFQCNSLSVRIQATDLLFIDTLHTYKQLRRELMLHSMWVKRFIILHDTVAYGEGGEDGTTPGLRQAAQEVLGEKWNVVRDDQNNNGLMVFERRRL